ncbi:MAG: PstS family phosphate ABC transporter substrate-binding protein [Verrucomicrobia bacterium]|nr:PstS family phosphate ABC transporter substrate-binding protein [Verrucomicrobiota bacterium]
MKTLRACLLILASACLPGGSLLADITVRGSDTMVILAQKWAEVYMSQHPGIKIQVTGGGTGTGFAALQNQQTDLCNASRPIRPQEIANCIKAFGRRPREYRVALDGLSVYVNAANPINELTLAQLEQIFTGRLRNWKDLGGPDAPIILYSRENSSGTYEFFKEHVLQGKDFAAHAQTLQGTAQVLQAVSRETHGIGYGGAAYGVGAKHLHIKKDADSPAIEPSEETVVSGAYPIARSLFVYVNPALEKGDLAAYLKWIRSDAGQAVVKDVGYFPLPPDARAR